MDKYTYEKELEREREREKSHGTGLLFIIGLNERYTCVVVCFFLRLALLLRESRSRVCFPVGKARERERDVSNSVFG